MSTHYTRCLGDPPNPPTTLTTTGDTTAAGAVTMPPSVAGMNYCNRCDSWYAQPGTCNCYAATAPCVPSVVVWPPIIYVGDRPYRPPQWWCGHVAEVMT